MDEARCMGDERSCPSVFPTELPPLAGLSASLHTSSEDVGSSTAPPFFTSSHLLPRRGSPLADSSSSSVSQHDSVIGRVRPLYNAERDSYADVIACSAREHLLERVPASPPASPPPPAPAQTSAPRRRRRARSPAPANTPAALSAHGPARAAVATAAALLGTGPAHAAAEPAAVELPPLAREVLARRESPGSRAQLERRAVAARAAAAVRDEAAPDFETRIPPTPGSILSRATRCGATYAALTAFVDAQAAAPAGGAVVRAVAAFVAAVVQTYAGRVLARVDGLGPCASPTVATPWALVIDAERMLCDMLVLERTICVVEESTGGASEVLDALYKEALTHYTDQILYKLFLYAAGPYLRMTWDWAFSACTARDGRREFFGTILGRDAGGSEALSTADHAQTISQEGPVAPYPAFIGEELARRLLRAGRARALLAKVEPKHPVLDVRSPTLDDCMCNGRVCIDDLRTITNRLMKFVEEVQQGSLRGCRKDSGERSAPVHVGESEGKSHCPHHKADASGAPLSSAADSRKGSCAWAPAGQSRASSSNVKHPPRTDVFRLPCICECCDAGPLELRPWTPDTGKTGFWGSLKATDVACHDLPVGEEFEAEWPPLSVLREMLVVIPLEHIDMVVQQQLFNHFVRNTRVEEHLRALWRYALLGAGDFADALVERIEAAAATSDRNEMHILERGLHAISLGKATLSLEGVASRQRTHLEECLRDALLACGADSDPFTERLSLELVEGGLDASSEEEKVLRQNHGSSSEEASSSRSSLWNANMVVSYKAEFPLDFIIGPGIMKQFSLFFSVFLRVRRAKHCLRRLFMTCRRQSSLRAHSTLEENALLDDAQLCTRIWRFCWEAEHFVRIVGEYEAAQVVVSSWSSLEKRQEELRSRGTGSDIWALRDAVKTFVEDASRRALLGERQQAIMKVISSALDIVVNLERDLLPAVDPSLRYTPAEVKRYLAAVNRSADRLQRRTKFLVVVLQKLVSSRPSSVQSYLVDLLNRLNYNGFY